MRVPWKASLLVLALSLSASAQEGCLKLDKDSYLKNSDTLGLVLLEVNWGTRWRCGGYDNAQLKRLIFSPYSDGAIQRNRPELVVRAPSGRYCDDGYTPLALLVEPGAYALSEFKIQTSRSIGDLGHMVATEENLFRDGKPTGGTFWIRAGEIVYIGHFSLECKNRVCPQRTYLENREAFEQYVADFRGAFPYTASKPVEYRLFDTKMLGQPFKLANPTVEASDAP